MATNHTTNYELSQWLSTDSVLRADFNEDNAKVDAALKSLSDQVVQKANQSAVDTLITAVNQKADQDDLTAAVGRIAALEGGKADQTSFDQAVSTLTAADRLVFLSQTSVNTATASLVLPLPSWTGAWELQVRYNITASGEVKLSFNNGASCYNTRNARTVDGFSVNYAGRTSAAGLVRLRPCGSLSAGRITCHGEGLSLSASDELAYSVTIEGFIMAVAPQAFTQIKFTVSDGMLQAGSSFAFYCVK